MGGLKNELIHHQRYATRAEAQAAIQEYIESFYNRQWRHSRLGYTSPAAFAEELSRQQTADSSRQLETRVSNIDSTSQLCAATCFAASSLRRIFMWDFVMRAALEL